MNTAPGLDIQATGLKVSNRPTDKQTERRTDMPKTISYGSFSLQLPVIWHSEQIVRTKRQQHTPTLSHKKQFTKNMQTLLTHRKTTSLCL